MLEVEKIFKYFFFLDTHLEMHTRILLNVFNVTIKKYLEILLFEINNALCNEKKAAFAIVNLLALLFPIYALEHSEPFFFLISFIFNVV